MRLAAVGCAVAGVGAVLGALAGLVLPDRFVWYGLVLAVLGGALIVVEGETSR